MLDLTLPQFGQLGALLLLTLVVAYGARHVWRVLTKPSRVLLSISSHQNVPPCASAQIVTVPRRGRMRPERLIVTNADAWIINDVRIQGVSQFAYSGDVPGEVFSATALDGFVRFDEIPRGGELEVVVTYIGDRAEGMPFVASMLGARRPFWHRRPRDRRDHPGRAGAVGCEIDTTT